MREEEQEVGERDITERRGGGSSQSMPTHLALPVGFQDYQHLHLGKITGVYHSLKNSIFRRNRKTGKHMHPSQNPFCETSVEI